MPAFSVYGSDTNTATTTMLYFVNGASNTHRLKLYEVIFGSAATPGDQAVEYNLRRIDDENATPGGSAVTPAVLEEGATAAFSNAVEAPSGEPTFESGQILELAVNQRATWRWIASPGSELICTAAEDTGFGIFSAAVTTAFAANFTMLYLE